MRAERAIGNIGGERMQFLHILRSREPINKSLSNLGKAARADATRDRLPARLIGAPARQHRCELWDRHALVNCKECAGPNMSADSGEAPAAVRRARQEVRWNEAARWTADEQRLDRGPLCGAPSRGGDLREWRAGWHFHHTCVGE
jgi:hypothetical protein